MPATASPPVSRACRLYSSTTAPGYRVYYAQRGPVVVLLLMGGDKRRRDKDIKRAAAILAAHED